MSIRELRQIMDSTGDAAVAVDSDGLILAVNSGATELLGVNARDLAGRPCSEIFGGTNECGVVCEPNCCVLRAVRERRPLRNFDVQINVAAGRRWCNVTVLQGGAPGALWAIHILRAVDLRKRLEMVVHEFVATATGLDGDGAARVLAASRPALQVDLTRQEVRVLRHVGRGLSTEDVASELGISKVTVANHVQRAMGKLGARSRLDAVRRAQHGGLL